MRKKIAPFLAGMATMAMIVPITVTAMAATGRMSIEVDPINIQVNGEVFQPKDATGAEVPVFAYHGTTYAPLRALAEAYGLEVGYDAEKNMATVHDPDFEQEVEPTIPSDNYADWTAEEEAAYQEFKGMWNVRLEEWENSKNIVNLDYKWSEPSKLKSFANTNSLESVEVYCLRFETELYQQYGRAVFLYKFENQKHINWLWSDEFRNNNRVSGYSYFGYDAINKIPDV